MVNTAQAREDATRRAKLPTIVRDWHNATAAQCPRQIDLTYNEEVIPATRPIPYCSIHDPEPEHTTDLATIRHHFQRLQRAGGRNNHLAPRSDGTHRALKPQMVQSLVGMLTRWRDGQWAKIRTTRDSFSRQFMPDVTVRRIAEKAHVCTTMERLRQVLRKTPWPYVEEFGPPLLTYLSLATAGFDEIFEMRKLNSAYTDSDSDSSSDAGNHCLEDERSIDPIAAGPSDGTLEVIAATQRIRLVVRKMDHEHPLSLQPDHILATSRSPNKHTISSHDISEASPKKRIRRGKENQ